MTKVKQLVSKVTIINMHFSFIYRYLTYGSILWGNNYYSPIYVFTYAHVVHTPRDEKCTCKSTVFYYQICKFVGVFVAVVVVVA